MMSRKNYQAVADAFAEVLNSGEYDEETWRFLRARLTRVFAADNPAFKPDVFEAACLGSGALRKGEEL